MESAGDAESRQTKDTLETIRFNQNQADSSRPAGRRRPALRAPAEPASSQIFMVRLRGALTGLRASIGSIGVSKATPASQIGRAHVWNPVNNAHLVCRLLLDKHI